MSGNNNEKGFGVTRALPVNGWYAVGGSNGLARGDLMPATLFGSEMVVWRGEAGAVHAWENRCVHRGMRLTLGFVDGDTIGCRYHGWRYGAGGKCTYIPAHPEMPPPESFCVSTYPSHERHGLIWASTGAPEDRPPALGEMGGDLVFCRSLNVHAAPEDVAERTSRALFPPFRAPGLSGLHRASAPDADGLYRCAWTSGDGGSIEVAYESSEIAPGVLSVLARQGDAVETVVMAFQPISSGRTGVHILAGGGGSTAQRLHMAEWGRRLRWFLENPEVETSSWRPFAASEGVDA